MKFSGGDLVENGCFQGLKLANVGGFSDFSMGRQLGGDASENGDFQRGKQRLHGSNFFQELSFYIQKEIHSWGRCVGKWRFSKRETAFAGPIFSGALIIYF